MDTLYHSSYGFTDFPAYSQIFVLHLRWHIGVRTEVWIPH